jgi:hypothetical protein
MSNPYLVTGFFQVSVLVRDNRRMIHWGALLGYGTISLPYKSLALMPAFLRIFMVVGGLE